MALKHVGKEKRDNPKIVITSFREDDDFEEYCNVQTIKNLIPYDNVEYVPITDLIFPKSTNEYERGLYTSSLEKIDVLYRPAHPAHPIDFLIYDVATDGNRIGLHLLDLVKDHKLAIINPPVSYFLQSKVLMMLIWGCRESEMFTKEERHAIEKYMLPTYLTESEFLKNKMPYVKKSVYSREGNTIEIYDGNGRALNASGYRHYEDNQYIYQKYINLPEIDTVNIG
ncbi:glutathionylspermidine synthase family protein [Ureibacillus sp. FSL K6-0165]|uniref:glutathionylspermidine synthase family protein n=1 Tax=Ureibacillus sp. FSL K6-0165 TaxID=2954606 RepID=UPI0030F67145